MFGVMIFERDPLQWKGLLTLLVSGVQDAGGFATLGAAIWLLISLFTMRAADRARIPSWLSAIVIGSTVGSILLYVVWLFLRFPEFTASGNKTGYVLYTPRAFFIQQLCLTLAGTLGIIAVGLPFLLGVLRIRGRRVLAIAILSFREAVRGRVLYVFLIVLLVFLFGSWFISPKAEDQVRTYVQVVFLTLTLLLLLAAVMIAAFSIPADIRSQTIHTILTKPVERFEIVLGRFLGFTALMTVVLAVMSCVSLLYIVRGVSAEAAEESLKAREPMNGELSFRNTSSEKKGENVGKEWDYRSYITAGPAGRQPTAIWSFDAPPRRILNRNTVRCEFGFDVYRTTKGFENKGVACAFRFVTANHDAVAYQQYLDRRPNKGKRLDPAEAVEVAEQFGLFEIDGKDVTAFHTQFVDVPSGVFKKALDNHGPDPALRVEVRCNDQTQYVGMAKYDLYLRLDDPESGSERVGFAWNFLKGSVGLWYRLCLVIGLGVAFSTYLSGVISMLLTGLLFLGGFCQDFIRTVGAGTSLGGGPFESVYRLATRTVMAMPLDKTGTVKVAETTDKVFQWVISRVLNVLPDVDRFDLTGYVSEGFNIPADQLLMNFVMLLKYLLPWAVLAYYLLKWREVASST